MDIAFVIDSSGSIGRTNWEKMKRFLKALVSRLDVSPSATHIAAIAYSNNPEVVMRFNGVQGTNQVNQLLDGMRHQRGFTYIDKALLLANSDLFQSSTGMRSNVPKVSRFPFRLWIKYRYFLLYVCFVVIYFVFGVFVFLNWQLTVLNVMIVKYNLVHIFRRE